MNRLWWFPQDILWGNKPTAAFHIIFQSLQPDNCAKQGNPSECIHFLYSSGLWMMQEVRWCIVWEDQYFFLWMLMMWWHPTWILGQLLQESEVFRREIALGSTSWICSLEWIAINVYQITSSRLLYPPSSVILSQRIQVGNYLLSN